MNHPFTGVSSFYEINMKFQISFRKINVKYFYFPIDCFSHCRFHSTHSPRRSSPAILYRLPFSGLSARIPENSVLLLLSAHRPPARHDHTGTLFPALHRFPFFSGIFLIGEELIIRACAADLIQGNHQTDRNILFQNVQHLFHMRGKSFTVSFSYKIRQTHPMMWTHRYSFFLHVFLISHSYLLCFS